MSNNPPPTGHLIRDLRWACLATGKPDTIECTDGWTASAMPDRRLPDPHKPLTDLWHQHTGHAYRMDPNGAGAGVGKGKGIKVRRLEAAGRMSAAVRSGAVER